MADKLIYKIEWCGPLDKTNQNCLTYYLIKSDVYNMIETLLVNSSIKITPEIKKIDSNEYIEAVKWYNIYRGRNFKNDS